MEVEHFLKGRKVEAVVILERRDRALHHAAELVLHASGPKGAPWSHRAGLNTMAAMPSWRGATGERRWLPGGCGGLQKDAPWALDFGHTGRANRMPEDATKSSQGGNHADPAGPHLCAF